MRNEVIYDKNGRPDIMVVFTPSELGLPDTLRGRKVKEYAISKYQNTLIDGVPYSLPFMKPAVNISHDEAIRLCESKGEGWHLITNDEWVALGFWSWDNDTMPTGNTASGKSHSHPEQTGTTYEGGCGKTLTGSGPVQWNHDGTAYGVADMSGNIWEHVGGVRFMDGMPQVIPNNGAAYGADQSKDSPEWEAIYAVLLKYEQPKDQSASVQTKRASYGQTYFNKYATKTTNDTQGGKTMSNSSLVDCTVYSPNHSGKRTHSIDRLTPHCVVGQLSAETIGACFPKGRNASCNYGIGYDGRVCLIVDECNRSWCSSSNANDQRAITIECASDKAEPYAMKSAVYEKLIKLCADICKRNGKTKVLWLGSKEKALAYEPKANEIVLTAHRWFANKSCPGDWLYSRYGELADRINALLGSTDSGNSGGNNTPSGGSGVKYYVQTGAYKQKANADAQLKKVKAAGFDAILKQSGDFYKVQTGAYSKKENANAEVAKLKAKGFDAIVTTNGGSAAGSANSEIKVGDVVQFSGGPHYGSAAASTAAGTPKAGPAKVTRIVKGAKHPYHIVHTDGQSSVYGWVNAANVSK